MKNNDNPIQSWAEGDPKLLSLINEINQTQLPIEEQAEIAFHKVSALYGLPKLPEDAEELEEETGQEVVSVYQELGLVKFLEPDEDIRGLVLLALYNVKNKLTVGLEEIYKKSGMKKERGICFKGENSKVTISFLQEDESWFDSGCTLYLRSEG